MNEFSVQQSSNIRAPRVGQVIALVVDAASRSYDISALAGWNDVPKVKQGQRNHFFISIQCETNDVFYATDQAAVGTNTIDDGSNISAGTALSLPAQASNSGAPDFIPTFTAAVPCARIISGLPPVDIRIDHLVDKTIHFKCASGKTAVVRFWPSSQNDAAADR